MAFVYLLRCADGSLYCGWTTDVERRVAAHNTGRASRYTARRLPVEVAASWELESERAARSLEWRIKQLTRAEKLALVAGGPLPHVRGERAGPERAQLAAVDGQLDALERDRGADRLGGALAADVERELGDQAAVGVEGARVVGAGPEDVGAGAVGIAESEIRGNGGVGLGRAVAVGIARGDAVRGDVGEREQQPIAVGEEEGGHGHDVPGPADPAPRCHLPARGAVSRPTPPAGLEPATRCLEGSRSVQLSYGARGQA